MTWHASLELDYTLSAARTVAHHRHKGPLRILQSLYPEGDQVCHNILVHPPSGLVGGDELLIAHHDVVIEPGDHIILFVADKRDLPAVIALFKEVDWH